MSKTTPLQAQLTVSSGIITSAGTILAANSGRVSYKIQNLGTNPLFVKEGAGASTTVFDYILAAGTGVDNGTGASYDSGDSQVYIGIITIAGTTPRATASERVEDSISNSLS